MWLQTLLMIALLSAASSLAVDRPPSSSVVTGANGYVGRSIVNRLLSECVDGDEILCLVREQRVDSEEAFWKSRAASMIKVLPYDMLDGGASFRQALQTCRNTPCVYHTASVFGPTKDHQQTALDNVKGTEDLVRSLAPGSKLVLTSSMAAVRASDQEPQNGRYYTEEDWNTEAQLGANWGASYQWSKAESERRAWQLAEENGIDMVSLCPSFIFGPPLDNSGSYSLTLVGEWARGESPVQSRLYVDVRDVAEAHVQAGRRPSAVGHRFIVSTEARIPSQEIADWLEQVCRDTGLGDPTKIHFDAEYEGGAIPIGAQEVASVERLAEELGVVLRPVQSTIREMAEILLRETVSKQ